MRCRQVGLSTVLVFLVVSSVVPLWWSGVGAMSTTCVYVGGSVTRRVEAYRTCDLGHVVFVSGESSGGSFRGDIKGLAADGVYVYAVGASNLSCKQYWQSNLTLRKWSGVVNGGTNWGVCVDGVFVYFGGAVSNKVYQCWASNMTKRREIVVNSTVFRIGVDAKFVYVGTRFVMKYWRDNLSKVATSPYYGGDISSLVTDGTYVYVGGAVTDRVRQLWCSNLSVRSSSPELGAPVESMWLSENGSDVYVGMHAAVSRIYRFRTSDWSSSWVSTGAGTHTYALTGDGNWLYAGCSNTTANTVREYFRGNLTRHLTSVDYGGEIRGCVVGVGNVWGNTAPALGHASPADGSTGVGLFPTVSIMVSDPDLNQTLTVCLWENHSVPGVWTKVQQNTSLGKPVVVVRDVNASYVSMKNTWFWWRVTACDGIENVSVVYSFRSVSRPPFTLFNDASYETSVRVHSGYALTDQVVHADVVYFPDGWGCVNGSSYKYWLSVQGYYRANDDYEQPCILVSNNISNDSWCEPANNYYATNPITPYVYNGSGHFCDGDIVFNDDTNELWLYILNTTGVGNTSCEIYRTSDGVNWSFYDKFTVLQNFMSLAVVKEGSVWRCWSRNGSSVPHLEYHTSNDGVHWSAGYDCGYLMRSSPANEIWHINVNKYNGEYWGFLVEVPHQNVFSILWDDEFGGGDNGRLYLIKSPDGMNWSGCDTPILSWGPGSAWDSGNIYRSDFLIQDGVLQCLYTGASKGLLTNWHAGYTFNSAVGGSGHSSNIIMP